MSAQLSLDNGSVYAVENGSFEQEMEPGDYKGVIKADGYADRAVEFSIKLDEATAHEWAMTRPFETPEKINFAGNSATLMPESKTELDAFAQQIKGLCEFKEIVVSGHTSLDKSDSENTMLSRARAQAVVDYLAGQGVDRTKLRVVGLGKSNPLAPNISSWGRKLNERIEFKLKK
jgi:outer membrane protein OmpA-like peptidoglycan-associated protein